MFYEEPRVRFVRPKEGLHSLAHRLSIFVERGTIVARSRGFAFWNRWFGTVPEGGCVWLLRRHPPPCPLLTTFLFRVRVVLSPQPDMSHSRVSTRFIHRPPLFSPTLGTIKCAM